MLREGIHLAFCFFFDFFLWEILICWRDKENNIFVWLHRQKRKRQKKKTEGASKSG